MRKTVKGYVILNDINLIDVCLDDKLYMNNYTEI